MSHLIDLEPGPLPIIPKGLWAELQHWMAGWRHAEALSEAGLQAPGALLLHGPTGSGKTSLCRALLKHMNLKGYVLEAHNVVNSLFGESERGLAQAMSVAESEGALLVIEEIDALGMTRRSGGVGGGAEATYRITIALMRLIESADIPIIATTNHRENLDSALLRRFELQIEVPEADAKGRAIILKRILGVEPPDELVALPLVQSIRLAHRMARESFIAAREAGGKK